MNGEATRESNPKATEEAIRKAILMAGLPAMLQLLLKVGVGLVNKGMVGQLGEAVIAGVGVSEQLVFLVLMVFAAVGTGVTTLASQYSGAENREKVRQVLGSAVVFGLLAAIPITLAFRVFSGNLLAWMGATPEIVAEGSKYLRVVALTVPSIILSYILTSVFRAFAENRIPLYASFAAILLDVSLSYHFLFVAKLGIAGVAYAALIARNAELLIMLVALELRGPVHGISLRDALAFSKEVFGKMARVGWPVSVDMLVWQGGAVLYTLIVLRLGTITSGVNELAKLVPGLIVTPVMGLAASATAFVGRDLGRGRFEAAQRQATEIIRLALAITLVMALLIALAAPFIPRLFRFSAEGNRLAVFAILATAFFQLAAFPNVICTSIIRAGGDTKVIIPITAVGLCLGLPAAYVLGVSFKFGLIGVLVGQGLGDLGKAWAFWSRYRKGAWKQTLV